MESLFDITADLDTPVSAYLKLGPFRPRFLLESVEGGRLGRYSFIGFGEGLELRLMRNEARVGGESIRLGEGPENLLEVFRRSLARAPRLRPEMAGFCGGLVGFAGFDLSARLLGVRRNGAASHHPDAAFVAPSGLLVFDHLTRRVALLHDGPENERIRLRRELLSALRAPLAVPREGGGHAEPLPSLGRSQFLGRVERAREYIAAGEIYQVVLSVRFSGECDVDPFQAYRALRLLNPSPYMYFLDLGDLKVVGSSPEALARLQGREACLRPIAGTRPRGDDEGRDLSLERELLDDPKEAAEHVMLVDLARNDLGRVALPGSIQVDPYRAVERYSHVMHLVSGVRGILPPGRDAFDLFAAAFPAGTVAGAPKLRAIEVIRELEPVPRGLYAGTVGYFGANGSMDQAIAIRTLVFRDGGYSYQAGAGIVADSRAEREHAEVMAKGAAMEAALIRAGEGL
jgi:anthranilate synthase component 1